MKKRISDIKFVDNKESKEALINYINDNCNKDGYLIMILHKAEELYGYLPYEIMNFISQKLSISINEIYSVVSFYTKLNLARSGKYQISVCLGTACYIKGNREILEEIEKILKIKDGECTSDFKFSIDTTRCLGCCGMAPVISINNKIYGNLTKGDIRSILESYK